MAGPATTAPPWWGAPGRRPCRFRAKYTLGELVGSCLRHPGFDVLSRDDPRPFVLDACRLVDANVPAAPDLTDRIGRACRRREPVDWREAAPVPGDRAVDQVASLEDVPDLAPGREPNLGESSISAGG